MHHGLSVCLALMLVAGRLNDLYMVLGNEAYADAMNPTIALGNNDPVLAGEATSIFAFQNIVPTLLDEELALLRGRDCSVALNPPANEFPIYNRLPWNFTADITHGQVAYVLNYGISDLKGDQNGVVDAGGRRQALSARARRRLGSLPLRGDQVLLLPLPAPELHLVSPSSKASASGQMERHHVRPAREEVRRWPPRRRPGPGWRSWTAPTARLYEEGASEPWRVQRDARTNRVWGVGEWGARVGMGAYFDWVMANALLPPTPEPNSADPDTTPTSTTSIL